MKIPLRNLIFANTIALSLKTLCFTPLFRHKCYISLRLQDYSLFLPTTISLTSRCCQKRKIWLHFFAEDALNDPKPYSYEDNAKLSSVFWRQCSVQQKLGVTKNFENRANLEEIVDNVGCTEFCILIHAKKVTNRLWKFRVCVPLRSFETRVVGLLRPWKCILNNLMTPFVSTDHLINFCTPEVFSGPGWKSREFNVPTGLWRSLYIFLAYYKIHILLIWFSIPYRKSF